MASSGLSTRNDQSALDAVRSHLLLGYGWIATAGAALYLLASIGIGRASAQFLVGLAAVVATHAAVVALAWRGRRWAGGLLSCLSMIGFVTFVGDAERLLNGSSSIIYTVPIVFAGVTLRSWAAPLIALLSCAGLGSLALLRDVPGTTTVITPIFVLAVLGLMLWLVLRAWERGFQRSMQRQIALDHLSQNLERLVAERTSRLSLALHTLHQQHAMIQEAKERAEAASGAKSDFLSSMSHELRTPLNSILGFTRYLLNPAFGELEPVQRDYAQRVLRNGTHLLALINDLLDLSKIEAGELLIFKQPVDLAALIRRVAAAQGVAVAEKGLVLRLDLPQALVASADERRIEQVLLNLLANAIKFTERGVITIRAARAPGEGVAVTVSDTGIGIDPAHHERIFEQFQQIGGPQPDGAQGTGLGLAICKRLIAAHGGRIWVDSAAGAGATFGWTLPDADAGETPTEEMAWT